MKARKVLLIVVGILAVLVIALAIFIATFDLNAYRPNIVAVLSKQTGRTVTLSGPIKLGFSTAGLRLAINDAAIANPSWASRPNMAGIGKFEFGVALLPLLSHRLEIVDAQIVNADIQLETGSDNKTNWSFNTASDVATAPADTKTLTKETAASGNVDFSLEKLTIKDSQLSIRSANGKVTAFKVHDLKFSTEANGLSLVFAGDYNGATVTLDAKTGSRDLLSNHDWPLSLDLRFADYELKADGTANTAAKQARLASYDLKAGGSELHGQMQVSWATAVPRLQGTIAADKINPADFKMPAADNTGSGLSSPAEPVSEGKRYVLSEAPLDLAALKSANATINFSLAQFPVGDTALSQITGKLNLAGGQLDLPFKAKLGGSDIGGKLDINGASPTPQLAFSFNAPTLELAELFKAAMLPALLSDHANVQITLAGAGNSPHAIAASASGLVTIVGGSGKFSAASLGLLGSGMAQLFSGGNASDVLNCAAIRFTMTNGIMKDNGILIDTAPTTMTGKGDFNFGDESINLTLQARPKAVNAGAILPPMSIGGTFAHPSYKTDPAAIMNSVLGILNGGSLSSDVPNVTAPAGQNACLYTLDHPSAAVSSANPVVPSVNGTPSKQQLKTLGNQLLKGLFGR